MDVDGTLTDGKIYISSEGELFKCFHAKDGCGIKDILPKFHITPIIITARNSTILQKRCAELQIHEYYQSVQDKKAQLESILFHHSVHDNCSYSLRNVAYIGDDLPDLPCMLAIKETGGIIGCPHDAIKNITELADYICNKNGGDGAIREFIEWLTLS